MLQHLGTHRVPGGRLIRAERHRVHQVTLGEADLGSARGSGRPAAFDAGRAVLGSPHRHIRVGLPQVDGELALPTADIQHRRAGGWPSEQAQHQLTAVDVGRVALGCLPVGIPVMVPVVGVEGVRSATADHAVRSAHRRYPAVMASVWNMRTVSSEKASRSRPSSGQLLQQVVRDGDDVHAEVVRLAHIEDFPGTGPEQFKLGIGRDRLECRPHQRDRVPPRVRDAAGEHRDDRRGPAGQRGGDRLDLAQRHERGHVHVHAGIGQFPHDGGGALPARVGDRDLHVDVAAPRRDQMSLAHHFAVVVGEDLERDWPVGDVLEHLAGKAFVVTDAGLTHQGRIRGEPGDVRLVGQFEESWQVGPVGKDLHALESQISHLCGPPLPSPAVGSTLRLRPDWPRPRRRRPAWVRRSDARHIRL